MLDNAPTYLTFFEMAKTLTLDGAQMVAGVPEPYLIAISTGAVFCGAMTYIGNGPNFMVKSVADSRGVHMPSFGGYIVRTLEYLLPILIAQCCLFIAESLIAHVCGVLILAFVLARAGYYMAQAKKIEVNS